jgi:hypothetical protein
MACNGAREIYWWMRFLKRYVSIQQQDFAIWCDNTHTVGMVIMIDPKLKAKLRHINIRHSWPRQEVRNSKINISQKPTDQMLTDGMAKVLPTQKHQEFVEMPGL